VRLYADPYNSCRNRHCPTVSGGAARDGLPRAEAELCHRSRTFPRRVSLPAQTPTSPITTRPVIYDICQGLGRDHESPSRPIPSHLGARHRCPFHPPHLRARPHPPSTRHMIVQAAASRLMGRAGSPPTQLLPLRGALTSVPPACPGEARRRSCGRALQFLRQARLLTNARAFAAYLAPLRNSEWVVYSKRPSSGTQASVCATWPATPSCRHL